MDRTVAEEQTEVKLAANQNRIRKAKDRNKYDKDGLKVVHKVSSKRSNLYITDDEDFVDLTRVTKLSDLV